MRKIKYLDEISIKLNDKERESVQAFEKILPKKFRNLSREDIKLLSDQERVKYYSFCLNHLGNPLYPLPSIELKELFLNIVRELTTQYTKKIDDMPVSKRITYCMSELRGIEAKILSLDFTEDNPEKLKGLKKIRKYLNKQRKFSLLSTTLSDAITAKKSFLLENSSIHEKFNNGMPSPTQPGSPKDIILKPDGTQYTLLEIALIKWYERHPNGLVKENEKDILSIADALKLAKDFGHKSGESLQRDYRKARAVYDRTCAGSSRTVNHKKLGRLEEAMKYFIVREQFKIGEVIESEIKSLLESISKTRLGFNKNTGRL